MTRFSFMGWGWRGFDVYPSILRTKNNTAYRMDKEPFSPVASTKKNPDLFMFGVSLQETLWAGAFPPLLISKVQDLTSGDWRRRRNVPRLQLPDTLKTSILLTKRALSKSDLFPNQCLVMSSSYICISRMFYALFFFEQVLLHLCALADVCS